MTREPKTTHDSDHPLLATRRELNAFLAGVAKVRESVKDLTPVEQEEALRAYVHKNASRAKQRRLFGRAFADALKSPSQKLGTAKAPAEPRGRDDGRGKDRRKGRGKGRTKQRRASRKTSRR
jgi:hypothetical protein